MCGIVGVAGHISGKEKKTFEDLLIFSQVRGPHSTGVASIQADKSGHTYLAKCIGRPDQLIDYDKRYDKVVDYNRKFMLGHNRWATVGKISLRNTHPFNFENIVGCHNGTIPEYRLKDLKKGPDSFGTDSETVLANINEEPIKDIFKSLTGAWAFVWYDRRNGSLNFLRNNQRELFYCYSKDRRTIFWASEAGFLKAALARNDIAMGEMFDVTPDEHHSWEIPEHWNKEFSKPSKTKIIAGVEGYSGGRFCGQVAQGQSGAGSNTSNSSATQPTKNNVVDLTSRVPFAGGKNHGGAGAGADRRFIGAPGGALAEVIVPNVKDFESYTNLKEFDGQGYMTKGRDKKVYRGYRGETLNKTQWEEATKNGCGWCDSTAVWGQPVRFIGVDSHICLSCNSDTTVREIYG